MKREVGVILSSVALLIGAPAVAAGSPVAHVAQTGPAPAAQTLQLVLPLAADTAGLERLALQIATPGSPQYANYRSLRWLSRRFGAASTTRQRVVSYLRRAGARDVKIDATGLFADARMTVALAQRVFGVQLARFKQQDGTRFIAPISAGAAAATQHVPAALTGLVKGVVGLDTRPVAHHPSAVAGVPSATGHTGTSAGCAAGQSDQGNPGFTPNQYLTAYDFVPLRAAGLAGQGETVALIEIDGFKDSDINAFGQCFGLPVPTLNPIGVGSVSHPLPPGPEATLDLEVLDAAAPALKEIDVYESNGSAADTLIAMTSPLGNHGHHPQVVSASLGLCEADMLGAISSAGLDGAEASLAEAAATGITYLASTGDDGSADCVDINGSPLHRLEVNYPASSWWVTGVGGTNFVLNGANQIVSQVVWNDTGVQADSAGGGGLSIHWLRPNYENGVVGPDRRAVPDVSMLADIGPGYAIYCSVGPPDCGNGPSSAWTTVGGTSAATPLLAGGFALVDQQLHAAGRQTLGLVNPLLYALGKAAAPGVFDDVRVGDNDVFLDSAHPLGCCSAAPGFDLASGWGSVNVANFASAALARVPIAVRVSLSLSAHQHPLRSHQIKAAVSCSGPCIAAAYALINVAHSTTEVDSRIITLRAAGRANTPIKLSRKLISKLRKAHAKRATVYGVVLDPAVYGVIRVPGESVRTQTAGKSIRL